MVARRRGKRKTPTKALPFEVDDEDVSPDNSESDCDERESKFLKSDSTFVESVVSALSNLENETKTETNSSNSVVVLDEIIDLSEKDNSNHSVILSDKLDVSEPDNNSQNVEENFSEVSTCVNFNEQPMEKQKEIEDGELIIDNTNDKESPNQFIQINFSNQEVSNLYKSKFLKFISSFNELEVVEEKELSLSVSLEKALLNEWQVLDETLCLNDSQPVVNNSEDHPKLLLKEDEAHIDRTKKKRKKKTKKEKDLFVLDTTPSQHASSIGCAKYMSKFNIDINDSNEEEVKISHQTCFNCEQSHALRDCPLPKNFTKINMMRQKFRKDKQTSRYHLEEEQKYAHLTPGKISNKLREALGLNKNQLPPYIYQMRVLGYPPGWLEEAKFVYSNLELFDTDGKHVIPDNQRKNQGLDYKRIVEYPGFNVPLEKDCEDDYKQYRVPPYSENYSKSAMVEYFEKEYSKQQDDFQTQDMDVDMIEESTNEKLSSRIIPVVEVEKNPPSPSLVDLDLVDLESEKLNLLAALEDSSSSNLKSEENTNDVPSSDNNKEPPPPGEEPEIAIASAGATLDETLPNANNLDETVRNKSVLNTMFGTPILKSSTPYSRLPNPDNFMKDVSPVINFENLPNSTGKYKKMTGLLQKVRQTLKNLESS
ncbi:unnamed protein product [Psylliodes chrysocephalus]|uniref:PSP proline-rich domain-containing protein n=1 Tax=Psylliodes chrysocephalus TaxID=3402493 RepID=A0A9P0CML9_9CUCU|nr:unnamed protein product [Psylliodes chrysocephala]